jgi:hypothetical protein
MEWEQDGEYDLTPDFLKAQDWEEPHDLKKLLEAFDRATKRVEGNAHTGSHGALCEVIFTMDFLFLKLVKRADGVNAKPEQYSAADKQASQQVVKSSKLPLLALLVCVIVKQTRQCLSRLASLGLTEAVHTRGRQSRPESQLANEGGQCERIGWRIKFLLTDHRCVAINHLESYPDICAYAV